MSVILSAGLPVKRGAFWARAWGASGNPSAPACKKSRRFMSRQFTTENEQFGRTRVTVNRTAPLRQRIPAMIHAELVVDLPPPGEAVFHAMPELDRRLIDLPAKINFLTAKKRRKVDQAAIQILDQAACLLDPLHGRLEFLQRSEERRVGKE